MSDAKRILDERLVKGEITEVEYERLYSRLKKTAGQHSLTDSANKGGYGNTDTSENSIRFAGFWIRFLAVIIDSILSSILGGIIVLPLGIVLGVSIAGSASFAESGLAGALLGYGIGLFVGWLWYTISESSSWQATVGKKVCGLKVTDLSGNRIGFARANGRYFAKLFSIITLGIGFLMVAFTGKKQGMHDKIASTFVIKSR